MASNDPPKKGKYIPPHLRGKKPDVSSIQESITPSFIPSHLPRLESFMKKDLKTECVTMTCEEFKNIPSGNGGRVGLCPWFVKDGHIQFMMMLIKVKSDQDNPGLFLSDIGGGLKTEYTPWEALIDEIKDETPQWESYLKKILSNPRHDSCVIVKDEYYPNKTSKENRKHARLYATIYVRIDPTVMNMGTFIQSSEVRAIQNVPMLDFLAYRPSPEFKTKWEDYKQGYNVGAKFIAEMLQTPARFSPIWDYFMKNITLKEYLGLLRHIHRRNTVMNMAIFNDNNSNSNNNNDDYKEATYSSTAHSPKRSTSKSPRTRSLSNTRKNHRKLSPE